MEKNIELIKKLGEKVANKEMTWSVAKEEYNKITGENITGNALRKRYYRINKKTDFVTKINSKNNFEEYEHTFADGSKEIQTMIFFGAEEDRSPEALLTKLKLNPEEWQIIDYRFGHHEVAIKDEQNRVCTNARIRIKPRVKEINPNAMLEIIDKVFSKKIKPINLPKKEVDKELDKDSVTVLGAVELHLGKEAREFDVGENYNVDIAIERYETIINVLCEEQEYRKSHKLIYGIGNDFLNIDTPANTTTRGTPQNGGISSYELFDIALKLQLQSLLTIREKYNEVEVVLVKGNHANQLEYALFRALQQRFIGDSTISFKDDYKEVQAIKMGNTSVFMSHGDSNYKRIVESMSKEFYQIYGETEHRYILLGHLHHKQKLDELNGFTVFRLSSPSGIDRWHYKERYLGQAGQEIFTFSKETGLTDIKYIPFQKVLTKRR